MNWVKNRYFPFLIIFFAVLIYYLPILIRPALVLERGNDLQEQFWPVFYFIRNTFLKTGQIPLWNNIFFSGIPILPDPQFSVFYPANWLFIILPTNYAFLFYLFLHILIGSIFLYYFSSNILKFSKFSSIFLVTSYISSPILFGYLEAGHYGLVASYGILPIIIFAVARLITKPDLKYVLLLSLSFAALFFTHSIIFIASLVLLPVVLILLAFFFKIHSVKIYILLAVSIIFCLGLTAVTFLPQIEWLPYTTRNILLQNPDVYPKWSSFREYFGNLLPLFFHNKEQIQIISTDKWIAIGATTLLLVFIGFRKLKLIPKLTLILFLLSLSLLGLNNKNPINEFLVTQNWYLLLRVATRPWIFISLTTTILSGVGLEYIYKKRLYHYLSILLFGILVVENTYLGWVYLNKKTIAPKNMPVKLIELLKSDKDIYRVFCTTKCISQQEASIHDLQLIEGYNTLQQQNYYSHTWQLMGGYWNYYTLSLPPYGTYENHQLQPSAKSLGEYNTKYIISPYPLLDTGFQEIDRIEIYFVYQNKLYKPRSEAPIILYTPNLIRVDISNYSKKQLTLSEVYSPGWKAYINGEEEILIQETPIHLRYVDIIRKGSYIDFRYRPDSYFYGKLITTITIVMILLFSLYKYCLRKTTTTKPVRRLK